MFQNHLIKKIKGFKYLPEGWANGSGGPISEKVINHALVIAQMGKDVDAFPGEDDEILLTFYSMVGLDSVDILIKSDLTLEIEFDKNS